jgi:glycosyltransferase involved in cell wall biosynthesis
MHKNVPEYKISCMKPSVSIIIPCYNSGEFLPDALDSVMDYNGRNTYEVLVIDDGSSDAHTLTVLESIKQKAQDKVLHQTNKGPAAARNTGVRNASADFLLFLDSDNKIQSTKFIDSALRVMRKDNRIGVFHGNPAFFGTKTKGHFESSPFDLRKMLYCNHIDMCSMVRKAAWIDVGGFDENRLIIGHEDWDLWLAIFTKGWTFYHFDEAIFEYRIRQGSLVKQASKPEEYKKMQAYIMAKHAGLLHKYYRELYRECSYLNELHERVLQKPVKTFTRIILEKYKLFKIKD